MNFHHSKLSMLRDTLVVLLLITVLMVQLPFGFAQGTSISYQGILSDGGNEASGSYDFQFVLRDTATGPGSVGPSLVVKPLDVVAGVFNATLDFGSNAFTGAPRWLEI